MKYLSKLKNDRQDLISNLCENIASLEKIAFEQQAEIERLEKENKSIKYCYEQAKSYNETLAESCEKNCKKFNMTTRAEAIKEFAEMVQEEIADALHSNYKARAERAQKIPIYTESEFLSYCSGKIDCLRGLAGFIDNLVKEKVGEENV